MDGKTDIQICLGSSCFSRGNKRIVRIIEEYIKNNNLTDQVYFHGGHCFAQCEKGPTILARGKYYHNLTEQSVKEVLFDLFGK